jgi:prevent-host-death family protein
MMTTVTAYEAKTHLPRLIRAVERGDTLIITRYCKPVAQLGPVQDQRCEDVAEGIERLQRARARRPKMSVEEILAARHKGHQY